MKIVFTSVTDTGILRNKKELIKKLLDMQHEIFIIAPNLGAFVDLQALGCKVFDMVLEPHGKNPIKELHLYKNYLRLYKIIKPDMVFSLTIKPAIFSGLACKKLKIPYFPTINGIGDALYNPGLTKLFVITLLRISLSKANTIIFQNISNKKFFSEKKILKKQPFVVVPGSGINLKENNLEKYPHNKNLSIIFIGRLTIDKGVLELFEAIKIIKQQRLDILFTFAGPLNKDVQPEFLKMTKTKLINYIGVVPHKKIHSLISKNDAVILPSYHEGISNVLLEAAASGRPILSSYAEGCEETFIDGVTGIGFEPKNYEDIVRAILEFANCSFEIRKEMGLKGRQYIEKVFNRDFVDNEYIKLVEGE